MSVEYYYMNDLNTLYNASVGDKTDGGEHHMKMMVAHDNLEAYMQKMEHWRDTALQLSRNNGEAQAKINALEADYVISNRELLVKQVEIQGLTARIAELEEAQKEALSLLPELERGHYYCDDCWYSCPKAVDGCCDERQGDECNCGADDYNALLAKIIGLLTPEVQE